MNSRRFFFLRLSLCCLFAGLCPGSGKAQLDAFFDHGVFNTPKGSPYLETYLTILGKSLKAKKTPEGMQTSAHVSFLLLKDSLIVKAAKYNLNGPHFESGSASPALIDNQRYLVPEGEYDLEMVLSDNNDPSTRPLTIRDRIRVRFPAAKPALSSIQPLQGFSRAAEAGPLTKSGFDLVPYTLAYYPESVNEVSFYTEIYNMNLVSGEGRNFVCRYFVRPQFPNGVSEVGSARKLPAAAVNPVLGKINISSLPSGEYQLVVEVIDEHNVVHLRDSYGFSRSNGKADAVVRRQIAEERTMSAYVGGLNNVDTLKMFVECLWPIANNLDKERVINQAVKKDPELMKRFIVDFWERRAADTADPVQLWANYYQQVQKVMKLFRCGKEPGYYSERGRVYLQYGPPNQRSEQPNEPNTYPYEIWQYYRLTDNVNGQFYTNRRFVFVNKNIGDDCHTLVHSDVRGEINNPRWQFEVTRRNMNGFGDIDNNTPGRTEHNQFNEIYQNPR